jgi:class 3 adenylate cyclase/tetratricopeptide (TPR) repeat protein
LRNLTTLCAAVSDAGEAPHMETVKERIARLRTSVTDKTGLTQVASASSGSVVALNSAAVAPVVVSTTTTEQVVETTVSVDESPRRRKSKSKAKEHKEKKSTLKKKSSSSAQTDDDGAAGAAGASGAPGAPGIGDDDDDDNERGDDDGDDLPDDDGVSPPADELVHFHDDRRFSAPSLPVLEKMAAPQRSNSGQTADHSAKRRSGGVMSRLQTVGQSIIGSASPVLGKLETSGSATNLASLSEDSKPSAANWLEERASLLKLVAQLQKELEVERKERVAADVECAKLKTQLLTLKSRSSGATPVAIKKPKFSKEDQAAVGQAQLAENYLKHTELRKQFWDVAAVGGAAPAPASGAPDAAAADTTPELLSALRSYVSHLVLRRLAANANALDVKNLPIIERYESTVVFADISGFTPLTERMAAKGREGVEKLTGFLNQFFGELVAIVHEFGGDIVKFAGDAVLAHWPSAHDAVAYEAVQACQCSLALQERLHNFKVEGGVLTLHVGVATGNVAGIYVGGEQGHIEFLISGEALDLVAKCEKDASPGQVCIAPSTFKLVEPHVKAHVPKGISNYLLDSMLYHVPAPEPMKIAATPLIADPLRAFLAPAVAQRLRKGEMGQTTKFLAELRTVSVLFVSLQIAFHGDDNDVPKVQDAVLAMQRTIYRYAGTLRQFIVDDKGSVLIAAWGLPPLAHEDDPKRAVLAALEIAEALFKLSIMTSVGVTTGQTFCGDVGSEERREYAVVGDVVNLSARLMAHSNVGVLCDGETYKATSEFVEYVELAPIRVKGKKDPIPVFKPRSAKSVDAQKQAASRRATTQKDQMNLIARARETGVLEAAVQRLVKVAPDADKKKLPAASMLIVQGAAGVGKTRLLAELRFKYLQAQAAASTAAGDAGDAAAAAATDSEQIAQLQAQIDEAVASKNLDRAVDLRDHLQALKAMLAGGVYLVGQGSAINLSIRFHAWASIIEALVRSRDSAPAAAPAAAAANDAAAPSSPTSAASSLPQLVGHGWAIRPEVLQLLGPRAALLNGILPGAKQVAPQREIDAMAAQVRAEATNKALLDVLQAFLPLGSVLAFDDAQYLDSASWKLLSMACQQLRGVLIVISARPPKGRVGFDFYQILKMPTSEVIELAPFKSDDETRKLVAQLLGVDDVAANIAREVHAKSEGNPFVVVEVVQSLRSMPGFAVSASGDVRANQDPVDYLRNTMPRNVSALITSKIDRLALSQQTALKFAAVIGYKFAASMVKALLPEAERGRVDADLNALCRAGLLKQSAGDVGAALLPASLSSMTAVSSRRAEAPPRDGAVRARGASVRVSSDEAVYTFCNGNTHDVVYDLMLFAQRRELHGKVADEIRRVHGDGQWSEQPLLAHHYRLAENFAEALTFYKKAGDVSTIQWVPHEAVLFYREASQIADQLAKSKKLALDPLDHISIKRKYASALLNMGDFADADVQLREALDLLGLEMPSEKKASSRSAVKNIKFKLKPGPRRAVASDAHKVREAIVCLVEMTRVAYFQCQKTLARYCVWLMLELVSDEAFVANNKLMTAIYRASIITSGLSGDVELAELQIVEGVKNATEHNQIEELGRIHQSAAMYYSSRGQWALALHSLGEATTIAERIGDRRILEECIVFRSHVQYLKGALKESLSDAEEALRLARERGDVQTQEMALLAQARTLYFLGKNDQCVAALTEVGAAFASDGEDHVVMSSQLVYTGLLALTQLQSEQYDKAYVTMRKNMELLQLCEPTCYFTVIAYQGVVEVLIKLMQIDEALMKKVGSGATRARIGTEMSAALDVLYEFDQTFVISKPRSLLWHGVNSAWKGRIPKSNEKLAEAVATADQLGMVFDKAIIFYYMGVLSKSEPSKSQPLLKNAFDVFSQLGVVFRNQL